MLLSWQSEVKSVVVLAESGEECCCPRRFSGRRVVEGRCDNTLRFLLSFYLSDDTMHIAVIPEKERRTQKKKKNLVSKELFGTYFDSIICDKIVLNVGSCCLLIKKLLQNLYTKNQKKLQ